MLLPVSDSERQTGYRQQVLIMQTDWELLHVRVLLLHLDIFTHGIFPKPQIPPPVLVAKHEQLVLIDEHGV
jgi:hypothetical protein